MNENEFIEYVMEFYGDKGIYDIKATKAEIQRAINIRKLFQVIPVEFDSVDREFVRDIILEMRK